MANEVGVVGVWGQRQAGPEDVAMAIVKAADRPLRKWTLPDPRSFEPGQEQSLRDAVQVASVLDAVLWIQTGALTDPGAPEGGRLGEALADQLSVSLASGRSSPGTTRGSRRGCSPRAVHRV